MNQLLSYILVASLAISVIGCNPKPQTNTCGTTTISDITSETEYPEWSENAVLYEVNVRQYTHEGTFNAFAEHLPRLRDMGVDILWIMPIHPISEKNRKGTLGSYYAVKDYKGVNPEFGTVEDFNALVKKSHELGMKVILDWVANHTGWDNQWIMEHPEWYTHDSLGNIIPPVADWLDIADLNYEVPEMRKAMIDAMKYWVKESDIDGYRCDVAWGIETSFWNEARAALDSIKPIWMLAEDEDHKEFLVKAFNSDYSWSLHHKLNEIAQGKEKANAITNYFAQVDSTYPSGSYPILFTSNHDENSWQGTEYERMGNAVKTMAALTFTLPGMPLIYSGQEAGLNNRLEFFEKDEINWSDLEMQDLYKKLIIIKKSNKALAQGKTGGSIHFLKTAQENSILAFERSKDDNKVVSIFNLSAKPVTDTIFCEKIKGKYIDAISGEKVRLKKEAIINLSPWEYKILITK